MFQKMVEEIDREAVGLIYRLQISQPGQARASAPAVTAVHRDATNLGFSGDGQQVASGGGGAATMTKSKDQVAQIDPETGRAKTLTREAPKVGRNDPCPCGSGKKYKKCHGA